MKLGVAGHNLFGIAYAWLLAGERGVREAVEFEMLLGMAQGQVQAVSREVGPVLLYVPVVEPAEFDVAISYLVRRLEENASSENFLSAAFRLGEDESLFVREQDRFLDALDRAGDPRCVSGRVARKTAARPCTSPCGRHPQPRCPRPTSQGGARHLARLRRRRTRGVPRDRRVLRP